MTTLERMNEIHARAKKKLAEKLRVSDRPCIHLGLATGTTRRCPSCKGHVELKEYTCQVHATITLRDCQGCKDKTPPTPIRFDHTNLYPEIPGYRFNPSLIAHEDGYLFAFRNQWAGCDIYLVRLDREFRPVSYVPLRIRSQKSGYGREDPRLFRFRGQLHVSFTGVQGTDKGIVTNQMYARLDDAWRVEKTFALDYGPRTYWEKNWVFFEHGGDLFAVYRISPHRILSINGARATVAHETEMPKWGHGEMRGGAPPVLVGEEWWHFFHSSFSVAGHQTYCMGLYTFEAKPPFRVLRHTKEPIQIADRATNPGNYCSVVFPGGAVREGNRWLIATGNHDRWASIDFWTHAELERRLTVL